MANYTSHTWILKLQELSLIYGPSVSQVHFLEHENHLLETKHTQLKETINTILQAKQDFLKAYQVTKCLVINHHHAYDYRFKMLLSLFLFSTFSVTKYMITICIFMTIKVKIN